MIEPSRAPVRPRVIDPETGDPLLLEDEVAAILAEHRRGAVEIVGGCGMGKTTALAHLAAVLSDAAGVNFLDEPKFQQVQTLSAVQIVVHTRAKPYGHRVHASLRLAPWNTDEWIEFLLALHPGACASVMERLQSDPDAIGLLCKPYLAHLVLDQMAGNTAARTVRKALASALGSLPHPLGDWVREFAWLELAGTQKLANHLGQMLKESGVALDFLISSVKHHAVRAMFAADHAVAALESGQASRIVNRRLPRTLVREIGRRIAQRDELAALLKDPATQARPECQAMAASILVATRTGWRPGYPPTNLSRAFLDRADWPHVDLRRVNLERADFTAANLGGANLEQANATATCFRRCCLAGANLVRLKATHACFEEADLSSSDAARAILLRANLRGANCTSARLMKASLSGSDLTDAKLEEADLSGAMLREIKLEGADLSGANLSGVELQGASLTKSNLDGVCLAGADLSRCDLEGVEIRQANFERANLLDAHLTASRIPCGAFRSANLRNTGLAEIDWPGADLRDADLRGCTFHMGSSRSGLVGSPIASEGSRTGFYTDELVEQHFKSPEEIRKANLCGADLRGARVDRVDFYLVDLRGARYDEAQRAHFARSGAILANVVP